MSPSPRFLLSFLSAMYALVFPVVSGNGLGERTRVAPGFKNLDRCRLKSLKPQVPAGRRCTVLLSVVLHEFLKTPKESNLDSGFKW